MRQRGVEGFGSNLGKLWAKGIFTWNQAGRRRRRGCLALALGALPTAAVLPAVGLALLGLAAALLVVLFLDRLAAGLARGEGCGGLNHRVWLGRR